MTWLLVAAGGAVGASLRFLVDVTVSRRLGSGWPWGTLTVNVLGCALLGAVTGSGPGPGASALLGAGLCGAFTTASTFSWEALTLLGRRSRAAALAYVVATTVLGLGGLVLGHALTAG